MSDNKPFPNRALQPRLRWGVAEDGHVVASFLTKEMAEEFAKERDYIEPGLEVVQVHATFLRMPAVQQRVGNLSKAWIYARVAKGEFPAPIPLGSGNIVVWLEHEIDEWMRKIVISATGAQERDVADEARVNP